MFTRLSGALRLGSRYSGLLFGAAGVLLVLAATRLGAGLTDDSYYYIKPVRDAVAGQGFNPSTSFSPMLPAVLLVPAWLGIEPLAAVRFLHALLFGVNICLAGAIARQITRSNGAALLAGLWVLLSENLIDAHAWAMSEALYFTFLLLALWGAARFYPDRRGGWLAASGIFAGLAGLTRYAGLAVIPAIALGLLLDTRVMFPRRLRDGAVFTFLGVVPLGLYFLRNILISGQATHFSRYLYAPFLKENVQWYLYSVLSWLIPGRILRGREFLAAAALAAAVLLVGAWAVRRGARLRREGAFYLLCLGGFAVSNFVMLYIARGFKELGVYNIRYLTPVLLVLLILLAGGAAWIYALASRPVRSLVILGCLAFSIYYGFRAYDYVTYTADHGLGYANAGWHDSETVVFLRQNPQLELVSTGDMGIYFWTGRLPAVPGAYGGPEGLQRHLCESGAALLIMNQMPIEIYGLDHAEAVAGLERFHEFNDSEMYRCPTLAGQPPGSG